MVASLLLAMALTHNPTMSTLNTVKDCRAARQLRLLNVPVDRADRASEIVPAVLLRTAGETLATLLVLRNSDELIQWRAQASATTLPRIAGISHPRSGELQRVSPAFLGRLIASGYYVSSCY